MNLKSKTIALLTPLIIIPILLIGAVSLDKIKQTTEDKLTTRVNTLLDQISRHIISIEHVAKANLKMLSEHHLLRKYAATEDKVVRYEILMPGVLSLFKNLQESMPDYLEIKFITPDGYEDAYWNLYDTVNIEESIANKPYFDDLIKSNKVENSQIIFDENTNQTSLLVSHKISVINDAVDNYGSEPQFRGYLAILVDLSILKKEIDSNTISQSGYLSVIDSSGKLLFSPSNYADESATPHHDLMSHSDLLINNIISKQNNSSRAEIDHIGSNVFVYWKNMISGTTLVGIIPENDLIEDSYELGKTVLIFTVFITLLVVLFVLASLQYLIMRPIELLNFAVQEIGNGNLNIDIDTGRNDEIGVLSKSFAEMSASLKQTHEEISYVANHDSLTGLPNRSMFNEYLKKIITIAENKQNRVSLLFIDLDNFKEINDTYGHHGGDTLLRDVASRLNKSLRKTKCLSNDLNDNSCDIVSRIGGDEFIVLLDQIEGPWDATAVSDRILKALDKPVLINNEDVYISCSIGIALYPDDAQAADQLIQNADTAMYHAKEHGKNNYQFYSEKLNTIMHDRLKLHTRLRKALEENQFFMHYQPKFDTYTRKIVGLEALIRWDDPEDGIVPPDVFIPVAEENGLISEITKWVMYNVCRQGAEWHSKGLLTVPIAVNISGIQFKRFDLMSMVKKSLNITKFPAELLELELTETSLLSETNYAVEVFTQLRALGISVALDDFGTGYSSLSYLNRLPINTLKIDRMFVKEIKSDDGVCCPIIEAIIALGHALNLTIVAEGVETELQLEYLKSKNCDTVQGFLLSKPLSTDDTTIQLEQARSPD